MLRYTLRLVARQLRREPVYSGLTIAGLAVGVAAFVLIALFVRGEGSFDAFQTKGDRLFRLNKVVTPKTGGTERHAITSGPMGPALTAEYPEVERTVRILPWFDDVLVRRDDRRAKLPDFVFADSTFFEDFSFELERGDPARVLDAPMSVVLTRSVARSLFGDADPIGQSILALGDMPYVVTGIARDAPFATHLRFDAIASYSTLEPGRGGLEYGWLGNWYPQALFTWVLLRSPSSAPDLEAKLPDFIARHMPDRADQYRLVLQPMGDLHLGSSDLLFTGRTRAGSGTSVRILLGAALLILVIAAINFVNMSTARATRRAHEVGVRKAVGADRTGLVRQFLAEHLATTGLAVLAGGLVAAAALPAFRELTGPTVLGPVELRWTAAILLVLVWTVLGLLSGAYPAIHLAGLGSAQALRGSGSNTAFGRRTRRVLVVAQFAVSIVLVAGSMLVYRQTRFLQERNPGFDREQLVMLPIGSTAIAANAEAFRSAIEADPGVVSTAGSNAVPGQTMMSFGINPEGKAQDETWTSAAIRLDDDDLARTYGFEMVAGRWFDESRPTDFASGVVINEALARSLGWSNADAVGRRLDAPGEIAPAAVLGVVRDFNFESMHRGIEPLFFYWAPRHDLLTVRLSGGDVAGTMDRLRALWERFDPEYPFEATFLDASFAAFYESERTLMRTLGFFASLSLLIAAIGLVALAAFTAERRTKEIGIRKVLGATTGSVVGLLSRESAVLVLVSAGLAIPTAILVGEHWLNGFAYRIGTPAWTAAAVAGGAFLLSFGIVALQAWRAARIDPARSLRCE